MKKLLLTTAVLLLLSVNTVSMQAAETISGKIIASADYMNHKLVKDNKTYDLKLPQATDLKNQQMVEVKGDFLNDKTIRVDEIIVIKDSLKNSS